MSLLTLDGERDPALQFDGAHIPAAQFRRLRDADAVLREAHVRAAQADAGLAARSESALAEARLLGFAQGRADGIGAVLGTVAAASRLRAILAESLAALVLQCLRTLLADLGDELVLRQRVLGVLAAHRPRGHVVLHIAPSQLKAARAALEGAAPVVAGLFTVVADPTRARDALLLETQAGFIDASLELTFDQWQNLIADVLRHAMVPDAESAA